MRDLTAGTTTRASVADDGLERNGDSGRLFIPATSFPGRQLDISDDGRDVVFASQAALVAADRQAGTTVRLSAGAVGVGIVVERSMWWPSGGWQEGHKSAGATATARRWAVAAGWVSPVLGEETYLLIASVPMSRYFQQSGLEVSWSFGAVVESDGPEIVVERAMSRTLRGSCGRRGATPATPLP